MSKKYLQKLRWIIDNSKEDIGVFISFILAIFPLSFVTNSYLFALKNLEQNKGTENIQNIFLYVFLFLAVGLMFVLIYIINCTIKIKARRYYLLFILGIKKKDFWKIIYKDYFASLLLMGIKSTIVINFASICLADRIWNQKKHILLTHFLLDYFIGTGIVCAMFFLIILMAACVVFYHNIKKEMLEFWESLNQNIVFKDDSGLLYYLKPILGVFAEILVIALCFDYRTIYYVAILQAFSFYLIVSSTECLRRLTEYNQKKDYKNIISLQTVIYQYKLNSKLIIVIYLLNFIVAFVVGGFVLSDLSDKTQNNYQEKYPFEYVIYGKNNDFSQEVYPFYLGKTGNGKEVAVFSLSSYENITKRKEILSEDEIIYISQHSAEDFQPLEGKQNLKIYFNSKETDYEIKDSRWEIIFGENISPKLENILVVNNSEFEINAANKINLWYGNRSDIVIEKGNYVWNRTEAIAKEKENNRYVMILVWILGVFLILEGQAVILIKQIVNRSTTIQKYRLLYALGISQRDKRKYFFEEVRKTAFYPVVFGFFRGSVMLGIIYFYQEGLSDNIFIYYLALCAIILIIQYAGYYCIALLMMKMYKNDLEVV